MSLKLFRRGSARCVGLLSAFVTILLCLYYISMGQQTGITSPAIREIGSSTMTNNPLVSAPAASSSLVSGFGDTGNSADSDSGGVNDEAAFVPQYNQKQNKGLDEHTNSHPKQDRNNRIYEYDLQQSKQHQQLDDKGNMNRPAETKDKSNTAGSHVGMDLQYSNEQLLRFHSGQEQNEGGPMSLSPTNNISNGTKAAGSDPVFAPSLSFIGDDNGAKEKGGHSTNWSAKCHYHLDESATNITAIDEYAKFDFQVNSN